MLNNTPGLSLLQQLKEGIIDTKSIDKDTRRQLVEVLHSENYTLYQIAQFFKCSEKTIQRDFVEIRKLNALFPSAEFARELCGEMVTRARQHCASLGRLSKNTDASIQDKIVADVSSWKVFKELIEKLQSLGYLPSRPTEIVSDVFHHSDKENTPQEMRQMIDAIEKSGREAGILDEDVKAKIKILKTRISQTEIDLEIKQLKETTNTNKEEHD